MPDIHNTNRMVSPAPAGLAGRLESPHHSTPRRWTHRVVTPWAAVAIVLAVAPAVHGQVRMKKQDRGRYVAPTISRSSAAHEVEKAAIPAPKRTTRSQQQPASDDGRLVQPVTYSESVVVEEMPLASDPPMAQPVPPMSWSGDVIDASCGVEATCGVAPICDCIGEHSCGVEGPLACDSFAGCGTCGVADRCSGCGSCGGCGQCICFGDILCDPNRWFATAEVLLWWREKQMLPPLVSNTTDPDDVFNPENILYGNQDVVDDMSVGGRFQVGFWLDPQHCQSIVGRGWALGQDSYGFSASTNDTPVIVRPFFDATDLDGDNDGRTGLVISGNGQTGSITIDGDSEVYGADISLRQLWRKGLGGRVDILYGYQHMRLNESLRISSFTTDAPPDVARTFERTDLFDIENEFHGGQIGFAGRFREGCWSWDGLFKLGFGSLRRGANLSGQTIVRDARVAPPNDVDISPTGLLVQDSNRGNSDDSTFAWIPEVNLTLVYHTCHNVDLSVGYGLVVMTDALRVPGAIDEDLLVDLDDPQTVARPDRDFRYDDFWAQGIQFGLDWWY